MNTVGYEVTLVHIGTLEVSITTTNKSEFHSVIFINVFLQAPVTGDHHFNVNNSPTLCYGTSHVLNSMVGHGFTHYKRTLHTQPVIETIYSFIHFHSVVCRVPFGAPGRACVLTEVH